MIVWCSYCWKYVGEKAPFQNFGITHGICPKCSQKVKNKVATTDFEQIKQLKNMFIEMTTAAQNDKAFDVKKFHRVSKELGIASIDLFLGCVQPALYEIGQLFSEGKITVSLEHKFTAFAERLLTHIEEESPIDENQPVDVLLTCVNGGYHSVGIRIVSLTLRERGINCGCIYPSIPDEEFVEIIKNKQPRVIGLNLSVDAHIEVARGLLQLVRAKITPLPKIAVGGFAVKSGKDVPEADFVQDPKSFQSFIDFIQDEIKPLKKAA